MITLLAPLALAGLGLLIIPILVHLFQPRRVRVTPFSSLRWLRQTQHKLSRRVQLHQWLLFLLRVAFIALLVLALARPIFSPPGTGAAAERFVILDVSRSTGLQPTGKPSPLDLGKQVAEKLITAGLGDDRTSVLLVSTSARALGPLVRDPERYLAAVRGAVPTDGDTRLTAALPLVRSMLAQRRPDTDAEIYFVTDNHQNIWAESDVREFEEGLSGTVRLRLVDVGVPETANAWIAGARLLQAREGGGRILRIQLGACGAGPQSRTLRLSGLPGLPDQTRPVVADPEKPTRVEFELPGTYELPGRMARLALEPGDALASDDQYLLNLDVQGGLGVLVVEGDTTQIEQLRPAFHLVTALAALAASQSSALDLNRRRPAELSPQDLSEAALIFLVDVPELSEELLGLLQDRVREGAGLAIFLGPAAQLEFYNSRVFNPLSPADGLLPGKLAGLVTPAELAGRLPGLSRVRWNHPLLAGLHDPVLGDLEDARFGTFYRLEPAPEVAVDVVAALEAPGDTPGSSRLVPAILDRPYGAGRILVFNTTANDQWSDLPRRKSYVPLVDRIAECLAGGGSRRVFEVGEPVTLSLPAGEAADVLEVAGPDGLVLQPERQPAGGRILCRVGVLTRAGAYRVTRNGRPESSFIVQAGRGDSVLRSTDVTALRRWWSVVDFQTLTPTAVLEPSGARQRFSLVPWVVVLGALFLLAEMYLVHRLCPRMNPRAITPSVRWRILAPGETATAGAPTAAEQEEPATT
ncbi:BatA domain-containing protein [bacterium]|nr:BatA domain-containing protein [bacterium]